MSELIADDLFLDRLAGRVDAGSEPLAGLLGALASQADTPLPSRTGRRRTGNRHRYFGAFAALAVAASGAGVAAAVTVPVHGPSRGDGARVITRTDGSARSHAASAPLSRVGLPQTSRTTGAEGLVLARRHDGAVVLVPAALVAAQARLGGATLGNGGTGNGETGKVQMGKGNGDNQTGGNQTGTPQATDNGKKPAPGTKGTKGTTGHGGTGGTKDGKRPSPTAPGTRRGKASPTPSTPSTSSSASGTSAATTGRPTP